MSIGTNSSHSPRHNVTLLEDHKAGLNAALTLKHIAFHIPQLSDPNRKAKRQKRQSYSTINPHLPPNNQSSLPSPKIQNKLPHQGHHCQVLSLIKHWYDTDKDDWQVSPCRKITNYKLFGFCWKESRTRSPLRKALNAYLRSIKGGEWRFGCIERRRKGLNIEEDPATVFDLQFQIL